MRRMAKLAPKRATAKRGKPCTAKAGTTLAIIDTDMSEAHVDAIPSLFGHGGARNRASRESDVLTMAKAQSIIAAAYYAVKIGLSFNRFVTIHFERTGIADAQAATTISAIMKLATDWMRKRGHVIAYAWVRENDTGDGSKGSHVHIICHCPDALPIGRMWQRWLRNVSGRPYPAKSIKSERIGGTVNCYANARPAYLQNLDRVLAYMVKGVSPADAITLGLPKQEAGGHIIDKRAGWSQNVGAKSRVLTP
jgi:hypothetical protein